MLPAIKSENCLTKNRKNSTPKKHFKRFLYEKILFEDRQAQKTFRSKYHEKVVQNQKHLITFKIHYHDFTKRLRDCTSLNAKKYRKLMQSHAFFDTFLDGD